MSDQPYLSTNQTSFFLSVSSRRRREILVRHPSRISRRGDPRKRHRDHVARRRRLRKVSSNKRRAQVSSKTTFQVASGHFCVVFRAATIILRENNCHFLRVDKSNFNRILRDVEANTVRLKEHGVDVLILEKISPQQKHPFSHLK